MSLGSQFRQLGRQANDFRQSMFGTDDVGKLVQLDYDRGQFTCDGYYSPLKQEAKTEDAGEWAVYDTVVRIAKTVPFVPARKKQLKITETIGTETKEIRLIIVALGGTHVASAEWVLACKAQN